MKFVKKTESELMSVLDAVLSPFVQGFTERFWTTIGETIYVPSLYDNEPDWGSHEWRGRHASTISHEAVHVGQFQRFGLLFMALFYLGPSPFLLPFVWLHWSVVVSTIALLPLSFGLAYGRWRVERPAYLIQIRTGATTIDWVVETLWKNYGWCWPKPWMRAWFQRQL